MNSDPNQPESTSGSGETRIRAVLPCRNCGYSLKGQLTSARCPECGRPVANTLVSSIDLQSHHRGPLPRPKRAAISAVSMAMATIALPIGFIGGATSAALDVPRQAFEAGTVLAAMRWIGLSGSMLGLFGVGLLFSAVRRYPFRKRSLLPFTAVAFLAGLFIANVMPVFGYLAGRPEISPNPAMGMLFLPIIAQVVLVQLILNSIGQRSFRFLQAGRGLQKASTLAGGVFLQMLLLIISLTLRGASGQGEMIAEISQIGWIAIGGLNLVGFAYLLMNAAWAVKPIIRAEHRLDQLLDSPPDTDQRG